MRVTPVAVGDAAPDFRLPAAQGADVGLGDYRGRRVIVWFTKGMGCAFCRRHMSQLARAYPQIQALGAEVLEIAPTPHARAKFYASRYPMPFPYLSDPDFAVRRSWGLGVRSHGPGWYVAGALAYRKVAKDLTSPGDPKASLGEYGGLLTDDDMGFFVVDAHGIVRYGTSGSAVMLEGGRFSGMRGIPDNGDVLKALAAS